MRISIIGLGYVGLVAASCLASRGVEVVGVEVDAEKVQRIKDGHPPFYEPGLEEKLRHALSKKFIVTTSLHEAVLNSDITFICVGTPDLNGAIDLSHVQNTAKAIGDALSAKSDFHIVVVRSTVVPGTTAGIVRAEIAERSGRNYSEFGIAMIPEFLREGSAIEDFDNPDRIVIGADSEKTFSSVAQVYESYKEAPILRTTTTAAEVIKYTSNSLLSLLISFSNQISDLCGSLEEVNPYDVFSAINLDRRLAERDREGNIHQAKITSYLKPGAGFGGSCFPKDTLAIERFAKGLGVNLTLISEAIATNSRQIDRIVEWARKKLVDLPEAKIGVLGVAFKPFTSDFRKSPAIEVINRLMEEGASVYAFDPHVKERELKTAIKGGKFYFSNTFNFQPKELSAMILVTEWPEFKDIEAYYRNGGGGSPMLDCRGILDVSLENIDVLGYNKYEKLREA